MDRGDVFWNVGYHWHFLLWTVVMYFGNIGYWSGVILLWTMVMYFGNASY
jgi:hypothetical protein